MKARLPFILGRFVPFGASVKDFGFYSEFLHARIELCASCENCSQI